MTLHIKKWKPGRRHKGVTLVEFMIAMMIMAVSLLGFYKAALLGNQNTWNSFAHTKAVALADERMSRIRSNTLTEGPFSDPANPHVEGKMSYYVNWVLEKEEIPFDTLDTESNLPLLDQKMEMMKATVEVKWVSSTGKTRLETLVEYLPLATEKLS